MTDPAGPTAEMIAAAARIARFMRTRADADLAGAFAEDAGGVTIIENFAPHVFAGPAAVADWACGFRAHARDLHDLDWRFGAAQDFRTDGTRAFFTLPTEWTGRAGARRFAEQGGWAFVLVRQADGWRVAAYAWAVTAFRWVGPE
ncbi:MAG: hypothetical protein H6842_06940 [Rhodospirillaceae bacterium]|nr:hypothetical protein [Rhodospirillaceae bacterium]